MKAIIYLEVIKDDDIPNQTRHSAYQKPILDFARQEFPGMVLYDFDCCSDSIIMDYAFHLVEEVEHFALIVDIREDASPYKTLNFFNKVIKHKERAFLIVNGQHHTIERLLKAMKPQNMVREQDFESQKLLLRQWYKQN